MSAYQEVFNWRAQLTCWRLPLGITLPVSDVILTVLMLLVTIIEFSLIVNYGPHWAYLTSVLLHILITAAQPLRHQRPRTSLLLGYAGLAGYVVLSAISPVNIGLSPALLTAATSLYTITRWVPAARWGLAALVVALLGSLVSPLMLLKPRWGGTQIILSNAFVFALLCNFCVVFTYLYARKLRNAAVSLAQLTEQAKEHAIAAERLTLARELHDVVGHSLTVVRVQAATALALQDPAVATQFLQKIQTTADSSLAAVREVVALLRHSSDNEAQVLADLTVIPDLIAHSAATVITPFPDLVTLQQWNSSWSMMQRLTLLRVLTEALTNASRHGSGTTQVTLTLVDNNCNLKVTNAFVPVTTGKYQETDNQNGYGLIGLQERARLMNAELTTTIIHLEQGQAQFELDFSLPIRKEGNNAV